MATTNSEIEKTVNTEVVDKVSKSTSKLLGCVKWFNNKRGYGFVTWTEDSGKENDIFVHHTGIQPLNSQYRTLTTGEYVHFVLKEAENGEREQAIEVTGVNGGPLLCDQYSKRKSYFNYDEEENLDDKNEGESKPSRRGGKGGGGKGRGKD